MWFITFLYLHVAILHTFLRCGCDAHWNRPQVVSIRENAAQLLVQPEMQPLTAAVLFHGVQTWDPNKIALPSLSRNIAVALIQFDFTHHMRLTLVALLLPLPAAAPQPNRSVLVVVDALPGGKVPQLAR